MRPSDTNKKSFFTGAQIIVKMLENYGIEKIAGLPGGMILPVYHVLAQTNKIQHILTRHEQAAGFIAQGMARTTGKPAVCIASSGPGATNLLTAIADAKLDSVPVICITGQVSSSTIGTDAFQEVDTYGISIPVTKHNYLVRNIEELPKVIHTAFRIAQTGRPGPVWIDIPKDIQMQSIEIDEQDLQPIAFFEQTPKPSFEAIRQAASLINQAKRPILYLGGGIVFSNSTKQAIKLAELAKLPTTTTLMGRGIMPANNPLSLGMLGMHGAKSTNFILQESDLLVVLGARFDDRAIGHAEKFCPNAKIIHVDIDRSELGKIKQPDIAIHADVAQVLDLLMPLVEPQIDTKWLKRVEELKAQYPCRWNIDDPLTHYGLIRMVADIVGENAIVTTDVGQHQMWVAQSYPFNHPRQFLTSGGLGTMGFGLPAAIGAALASPSQKIICFTGDGSIMMNIQEMATMVEHNLDIKIILLNNQALGLVHQLQTFFYEEKIYSTTYDYQTDFITIAKGFGMKGYRLNQEQDPIATLTKAINSKGPCIIELAIDLCEKVYPMVPAGAPNIEMIGE